MFLVRNPFARTAAVAVMGLLLAALPASAARGGSRGGNYGGYRGGNYGGYRGGNYGNYGGYRGGYYGGNYGGYRGGYYGGFYPGFGLGLGIGLGSSYYNNGYYGYGYDGGYAPSYYDQAPATSVVVTPDVTTSAYYAPAQAAPADNRARVEVRVPADAQVLFDGSATQQTGEDRLFVSPPLDSGRTYTYNIEARWNENGRVVDQTRSVTVGAGQTAMADFGR